MAEIEPTEANGFKEGRPEGRERSELDEVIRKTIDDLPYALRLYPDVYAWKVADAVEAHLGKPRVLWRDRVRGWFRRG